jgi:putative ABC transport system permease protein
MILRDHIKQAWANLYSAKLRSLLAALGILVGTASVVALVSSGELATQKALAQFKNLGTELMAINLLMPTKAAAANPSRAALTVELLEAMDQSITTVHHVAPYITTYAPISYEGHNIDAGIIGATENLKTAIQISLEHGRFISYLDHYGRFCVVGQTVYQQLRAFDPSPVIGKQLTVGKELFTIVGVIHQWPENAFFNEDINRAIIVPIAATQLISHSNSINNIVLRLYPGHAIETVQADIQAYFKKIVPQITLFFRSPREIIKSMQTQNHIFTLLLSLIGGISLLVGGIGVMNVMLVSVSERKREIGIRMAVGARRRDIQLLFLSESALLALFGGTVGVILGTALSLIIGFFSHWGLHVYVFPMVIGFLVSTATGIFFGYYPAYRAAQLDPITSLRTE